MRLNLFVLRSIGLVPFIRNTDYLLNQGKMTRQRKSERKGLKSRHSYQSPVDSISCVTTLFLVCKNTVYSNASNTDTL